MKKVLFFALICILAIVAWRETKKNLGIEPFQGSAKATPALNVPKVKPDVATLYPGSPQPFAPPTTALLAPPPGQLASVNSYVYEDPAMKKAAPTRIQSVLITLKGFLANEAPGLQKLGDPSATLPLGVARADAQRLEDELNVLARSPGLQSSLTDGDLNQVEANLGYLQRKWRMSANAMDAVEGFQSSLFGSVTGTTATSPMGALQYLQQWFGNPNTNYFTNQVSAVATQASSVAGAAGSTAMATLQDLKNLLVSVAQKVQQIQASGTQDEIMLSRLANLQDVQKKVQVIIDKIEVTKTLTESQIDITKAWYNDFMAGLAGGTALPALTTADAGPDAVPTAAQQPSAQDVLSALGPDALKNLSFDWNIQLRYTGETERTLKEEALKAMAMASLPGAPTPTFTYGPGDAPASAAPSRGAFDSVIQYLTGKGDGSIVDAGGAQGGAQGAAATASSGAPTKFDWKDKSKFICEQIQKREMDPYEYGCMKDTTVVSDNFSYRGYAKMICSRLATNYDPSIPELCGCPPPTWAGWRA